MEQTPVFEGEAQEEKKNYENQTMEESKEDGEIVVEKESGEQVAPIQERLMTKVEAVSEAPAEIAPSAEVEAKTEPKGVTGDSGFAPSLTDSTTELKTTTAKEVENTSETKPEEEPERLRKLFVAALPNGANEAMFREFYAKFGNIDNVFIAHDKISGVPKGYAFVTFTAKASVDAVIASRPHTISGQTVVEKRATPKGNSSIDTSGLFVTGITEGVDENALAAYFSKYGEVESVRIHTDERTKKPRGFAFVNFSVSDSADQCVVDSRFHMINGIQIAAQKALPKNSQNQRDREFRAQRSRGMDRRGNYGWGNNAWGMGMPPPPFYAQSYGSQYPPSMGRENQNLAYRASAGADSSAGPYPYPPPPMRAFLADMAANAAMGQGYNANQRPEQRRNGGGGGQGGYF